MRQNKTSEDITLVCGKLNLKLFSNSQDAGSAAVQEPNDQDIVLIKDEGADSAATGELRLIPNGKEENKLVKLHCAVMTFKQSSDFIFALPCSNTRTLQQLLPVLFCLLSGGR